MNNDTMQGVVGSGSGNGNDEESFHDSEGSSRGTPPSAGSSKSSRGHRRRRRTSQSSEEADEVVASRESRQLCWLRGIVLIALLLASFMVSSIIFYSSRKGEVEQYEIEFYDNANNIMDVCETHLRQSLRSLDDFGVAVTSYGRTSFEWPYVTIPDFGVRAASVRNTANIGFLGLAPRIDDTKRQVWGNWSSSGASSSTDWIEDALAYEQEFRSVGSSSDKDSILNDGYGRRMVKEDDEEEGLKTPVKVSSTTGVAMSIYKKDGSQSIVDQGESSYYPMWYHSPVQKDLINYNILSHRQSGEEAQIAINSQRVVISRVLDIMSSADDVGGVTYQATDEPFGEVALPGSYIYFPIFSSYHYHRTSHRELVGLLIATFDWKSYLSPRKIPDTANGIHIVVANACGDAFTFQVQQEAIVFVGEGDLHERQFDDMMVAMDLPTILKTTTTDNDDGEDRISSNGIEFNDEYCSMSLHIFPSNGMKRTYYSDKPMFFTIMIVVVFLFTAVVFETYDWMVERRQKKIADTAKISHKLVSSLFPAVVRNRLFARDQSPKDTDSGKGGGDGYLDNSMSKGKSGTAHKHLSSFLDDKTDNANTGNNPIADLFLHTTVMFADIAGFTAWSSTREPSHVFMLLETVYAAFDRMADRRKVFKVETIGDCYMAVTGLPNPQPDHPVIMARFSWDCLQKMDEITKSLAESLGPDTTNLSVRVGLHSGPVTAGVLRGQKSRFQLFGDTVNTAARMESTGLPNQVQCSQATAELLRDAGKVGWLEAREDKVHAKGKGTLSTFWLKKKVSNNPSSITGSSADGRTGRGGGGGDSVANNSQTGGMENDDDDNNSAAPSGNGPDHRHHRGDGESLQQPSPTSVVSTRDVVAHEESGGDNKVNIPVDNNNENEDSTLTQRQRLVNWCIDH